MELRDFEIKCKEIFGHNGGIACPDGKQIEKLWALTERMLEVNKSMNLTAITDVDGLILRHYVDSVSVLPYISEGASVIDIGCGAGFPTLPLAIMRPDLKILALDGTAKRIEYVKSTAKMLGLDNVSAISARAEELARDKDYRESFDFATARAVAALPVLSELCLPFVRLGGRFVAMKALQGESEADAARNSIAICGGELISKDRLELTPDGETLEVRTIITVKKVKNTPEKYPRHYSQISKKPL